MSYPTRGPALAGIGGKANRAGRRHHGPMHFRNVSEAAR
jgi:hypothetical protein